MKLVTQLLGRGQTQEISSAGIMCRKTGSTRRKRRTGSWGRKRRRTGSGTGRRYNSSWLSRSPYGGSNSRSWSSSSWASPNPGPRNPNPNPSSRSSQTVTRDPKVPFPLITEPSSIRLQPVLGLCSYHRVSEPAFGRHAPPACWVPGSFAMMNHSSSRSTNLDWETSSTASSLGLVAKYTGPSCSGSTAASPANQLFTTLYPIPVQKSEWLSQKCSIRKAEEVWCQPLHHPIPQGRLPVPGTSLLLFWHWGDLQTDGHLAVEHHQDD